MIATYLNQYISIWSEPDSVSLDTDADQALTPAGTGPDLSAKCHVVSSTSYIRCSV